MELFRDVAVEINRHGWKEGTEIENNDEESTAHGRTEQEKGHIEPLRSPGIQETERKSSNEPMNNPRNPPKRTHLKPMFQPRSSAFHQTGARCAFDGRGERSNWSFFLGSAFDFLTAGCFVRAISAAATWRWVFKLKRRGGKWERKLEGLPLQFESSAFGNFYLEAQAKSIVASFETTSASMRSCLAQSPITQGCLRSWFQMTHEYL
uniref:Uncharacterized protein n=1 Tax=Oryza glumipatula TaxID=40148 RepID=A0A0E0A0Z5_9ORYZ